MSNANASAHDRERRRNHALRAMIEEMLDEVREANRHIGPWSDEEREKAEAELAAIMARVRRQVMDADSA